MKPAIRFAALALSLFVHCAAAQTFPSKPVRVVVPFPPGGTSDTLTRAIAQELTRMWGQPGRVDNKPGAGTVIGAEAGAKAPPDGHTIVFVTGGMMTINPAVYKRLPYDPVKSFAPVTIMLRQSLGLVAHPSVRASNLKELVELAKAQPDMLNYASLGVGTELHLAMERFAQLAGIKLFHVPGKGTAQMAADVIAGTVQLAFLGTASTSGAIRDGRLKVFAYGATARTPLLPNTPTFIEEGYNFLASAWWGLAVPAGTPRDIINRIQKDVVSVIVVPEFQEKRMRPFGYEAAANTPEQFAAVIREELEIWQRVVKQANISVD